MNIVILIGLILAGSTIAFDHLMNELPQWLAVSSSEIETYDKGREFENGYIASNENI